MGQSLNRKAKEEIAKFFKFLCGEKNAHREVRTFRGRAPHGSGYYNLSNVDLLISEIENLDEKVAYFATFNTPKQSKSKKSIGKISGGVACRQEDIDEINYIYIDIDPTRGKKGDCCATQKEKDTAKEVAYKVVEYLESHGWPEPACINDSGNGYHIFYLCSFSVDLSDFIGDTLSVLSHFVGTRDAKIDTSVKNANRVVRIPGTMNRKGPNTPDRPHRMCKNIFYADAPEPVTPPLIEKIALLHRHIKEFHTPKVINKSSASIDEIEKKSGIKIVNKSNPATSNGDLIYKFVCPECDNVDVSGYIRITETGFAYKCFHESCNVSTLKFAKKFGIELEQQKEERLLSDCFRRFRYDGQARLKMPKNYIWEDSALRHMDGKQVKEITSQPLYIGAVMEDVDDSTEYAQLSFMRRGRWRHCIAPKKDLMNRQRLVEYADKGLSISSDNATAITSFLRCFDLENEQNMKYALASSRMGWQVIDDEIGFLLGQRYINKNGIGGNVDLSQAQAKHWPDRCIAFRGSSDGEQQLAASLNASGEYPEWKSSIQWAVKHPNMLVMVLASFSAPLLDILKQNNFVLDFCNRTSSGKTTGLTFAASIWGNPDRSSRGSFIKSWDSTRTNIERSAFGRNHLPLLMDDTKAAKDLDELCSIVYSIANGQGRGRGTITGTAMDKNFKTILVSTGEDSITDFSPAGGIMARVLQVSGPMFTRSGKDFAFEISENMERVLANYGWAGPLFVSYLIENQERWPEWRKAHRDIAKKFTTRNQDILIRLASSMAVISLCAKLVQEAGILDVSDAELESAIAEIWSKCRDNADASDREKSALYCLGQYLDINMDRVLLVEDGKVDYDSTLAGNSGSAFAPKPNKSYIARIETKDGKMIRISVNNGVIEKTLKMNGYAPRAIKSQWVDRGWCETKSNRSGSPTKSVRIGPKAVVTCVVFNDKACDLLSLYGGEEPTKTSKAEFEAARRDMGMSMWPENEESLQW
tara:strand:- start:11972 stop:14923 length:2952 start_codon:yes stop_codon:yes gene_type:complete